MTVSKNCSLVAFATSWGAWFGGVNAFNFDLLQALAPAFRGQLQVACVALDATADDCRSASSAEVQMVPLGLPDQKDKTTALGALAWKKLQEPRVRAR